MFLELLVVQPTKLSVNDCDVISNMHMNVWSEKDFRYDDLIENSFMIETEDLEMFSKHKDSLYHCFGYYLKATTVSQVKIQFNTKLSFDNSDNLPIISMQPLFQLLLDQYYKCDKFWYTGIEFIDFFNEIVDMIDNNGLTNIAIREIKDRIIGVLDSDKKFVYFELK